MNDALRLFFRRQSETTIFDGPPSLEYLKQVGYPPIPNALLAQWRQMVRKTPTEAAVSRANEVAMERARTNV